MWRPRGSSPAWGPISYERVRIGTYWNSSRGIREITRNRETKKTIQDRPGRRPYHGNNTRTSTEIRKSQTQIGGATRGSIARPRINTTHEHQQERNTYSMSNDQQHVDHRKQQYEEQREEASTRDVFSDDGSTTEEARRACL